MPLVNGPKTIEIFSFAPFLAEGEQILWENLKSDTINNKKQVNSIEALTNFRVLYYDYGQHIVSAILLRDVQEISVNNLQKTVSVSPRGEYSIYSHKLTGINSVATNNLVGNIVFYSKDRPPMNFSQISDPETLFKVAGILKQQYSESSQKSLGERLTCSKCGNEDTLDKSRFCHKCGSALFQGSGLLSNSLYIDQPTLSEGTLLNLEQHKIERYRNLRQRIEEYKPGWDKNGVIQYKTEYIAILQRKWGTQVEFIIAFDDLTREGYRLMAVDEGKSGGDSSGGFTGGVNAYFYFQNMKYVK